jgi:glycosyltransferase involved in cell wall biosynthesis
MKILLFTNSDWFMYNFNLSLASRLRAKGWDVVLLTPPGTYVEKLEALGFRCIVAPMERRSLNPFREILFLLWLRRLLKRERVDLVHSFTIKCAVYGAIASRLAGIQKRVNAVAGMGYVFTSHSFRARLLRPLVRGLMRFALGGRLSRLVVLNRDDLAFFETTGLVRPDHIRLLPGAGINTTRFSPKPRQDHDDTTRVLLPARMLWDKGVREFVEAAKLLGGQSRDFSFVLAGAPDPGNPNAVPHDVLNEWVRRGYVSWLGHVDDMPALFHTVDIVVLPSYREGLPTGLTEAAACELPLITTDVPGCREVVTHEVDGLLVPPRNAAALASAIRRLHDDSPLRRSLAKAARSKALRLFGEDVVIASTIDVYQELLRKPRVVSMQG